MPNPLSWYFHWMPRWVHHGGVAFNHFIELIVPFAYFAPQPVATVAGLLTILFQLLLMLSGNLSFLNLFTMVLAIPLLDGRLLARVVRVRLPPAGQPWRATRYLMAALAGMVAILEYLAGAEPHPTRPIDEFQLRSAASGEHLRRLWQHHAHPL